MRTRFLLICLAFLSGVAPPGPRADERPAHLRVGTFSLSREEAEQLRLTLERQWLPHWIGAATLEIRILAEPRLDRALQSYGSGDERFDLLEAHVIPYLERWPAPSEAPLQPFLAWSDASERWPRARRQALLLARADDPPAAAPGRPLVLACVSRHSWMGGQLQLRLLESEGHRQIERRDLGSTQEALRALKIGFCDLAAVPRDPAFTWGLPFDLSTHFEIYRVSDPQPPPVWLLSAEWGRAHPAGKAYLREVLREHFGEPELRPITSLPPIRPDETEEGSP